MTFEITKSQPHEYTGFFGNYVNRVHGDVFAFLDATHAALNNVSEAQAEAKPGPNEWSVKEVIGHIGDTERIFAYRALPFARSDATPLPGFDHEDHHLESLRTVYVGQ